MIQLLTTIIGTIAILIAYRATTKEVNNNDNPFAVEHIDGYDVAEVRYVRDNNGNWIATDVHYEKIDNDAEEDEVETIGYHCSIWKINRACKRLNIVNPIADMDDLPITELTNDTIDKLDTMRELMCELDESDEYGDILIEAIIELNTLLSEVGR